MREERINYKNLYITFIAGLITAFFVHVILINSNIRLGYREISLPFYSLYIFFPLIETIGYFLVFKIFYKVSVLKQAAKFSIVGFLNFSIDTGILSTLSRITDIYKGFGIIPLNIISVSIAVINSYFWNKYWTFGERTSPSRREFLTFLSITIIGITINSIIVFLITTFIDPSGAITHARLEIIAKMFATVIALFWNFFGYKFIVFKPEVEA